MSRVILGMLCASCAWIAGCDKMEPRSADASSVTVVHNESEAPAPDEPTDYNAILAKLRKPDVARPQDINMGRAFGGGSSDRPMHEARRESATKARSPQDPVQAFIASCEAVGACLELYRVNNRGTQPPFATKGWDVLVGPDYLTRPPVNHLTPIQQYATRMVPAGAKVDNTVGWVYFADEYRIKGALPNFVAVDLGLVPQGHKPGDPHADYVTY